MTIQHFCLPVVTVVTYECAVKSTVAHRAAIKSASPFYCSVSTLVNTVSFLDVRQYCMILLI